MTDPIVGIDLGTSTTVVAHADPSGAVQVLADDTGARVMPSVVSFHPGGHVLVGAAAKQRKAIDPQNTIASVKRLLGRTLASQEVATATRRMPYKIRLGLEQRPAISTRIGDFEVPALAAILLDHARTLASRRLATAVQRAVIAVPASFDEAQRAAVIVAAATAGLAVVHLVDEPIAAALACAAGRADGQVIAVYDFGAGAFDVTIVRLRADGPQTLGTASHGALGGDDLDEQIVDMLVQKISAAHRLDLRTNPAAMLRLRGLAEQTKLELSRRTTTTVRIDGVAQPDGSPLDLKLEITRDDLARAIADVVDRTFAVCDEAVQRAGLTLAGLDEVVLVGGTTKLPYIRDQVARHFGRLPRTDVNPEEVIARGAALHAHTIGATLAAAPAPTALAPILDRAAPRKVAPASPPPTDEDDRPYARTRPRARESVFGAPAAPPSEPTPSPGAIGRLQLRTVARTSDRVVVVPPVRRPAGVTASVPPRANIDAVPRELDGLDSGTGLSQESNSLVLDVPLDVPGAPPLVAVPPAPRSALEAHLDRAVDEALSQTTSSVMIVDMPLEGLSQTTSSVMIVDMPLEGLSQTTSSVMIVDVPLDADGDPSLGRRTPR